MGVTRSQPYELSRPRAVDTGLGARPSEYEEYTRMPTPKKPAAKKPTPKKPVMPVGRMQDLLAGLDPTPPKRKRKRG